MFFYLYLIVDIFSRKIVGWEVHEREAADLAATLIQKAVWAEACIARPLVLHADNGSPMKGATMKVTLEKLGITASYSPPVSGKLFAALLFLYFSGGRDRTMTWDTHRNARLRF